MTEPHTLPADAHDSFQWLSAWEAAQWFGVTGGQLLELLHHGKIPQPAHFRPLLWRVSDLVEWQQSGCPVDSTIPARHFRAKNYTAARNSEGPIE